MKDDGSTGLEATADREKWQKVIEGYEQQLKNIK